MTTTTTREENNEKLIIKFSGVEWKWKRELFCGNERAVIIYLFNFPTKRNKKEFN